MEGPLPVQCSSGIHGVRVLRLCNTVLAVRYPSHPEHEQDLPRTLKGESNAIL